MTPESIPLVHVVVYAQDLDRVAAFYEHVLGLDRVEQAATFVLLGGAGLDLSVVRIPEHLVADGPIGVPARPREDTPIKASFRVASIEACRVLVERFGGSLQAGEAAWTWRGQRHLDGVDPEGNVFQLRQAQD